MIRQLLPAVLLCVYLVSVYNALAYPPAVGILGDSKDCLSCHTSKGPWIDDGSVVIDLVDKQTGLSLKQEDGSFAISARRGESKTILTVIGYEGPDRELKPEKHAWIYVDTEAHGTSKLSHFAPGWNVNLPMACRMVGDKYKESKGGGYTVLPMTVRPSDAARDAQITLQILLVAGETVKGKAKEGLISNYFERSITLKVTD